MAFSKKVPDDDTIQLLFRAASRAPSSFNAQPWKFIYGIKDVDTMYGYLFDLINDSNQKWVKTAPMLALGIVETVPPGRTSLNRFAWYDTGMSVGNLLAQATDMGLYVHQMGGYDHEKARKVLNLSNVHEPAAMIAIGYKGDPDQLPREIAERENKRQGRKSVSEFVTKNPF